MIEAGSSDFLKMTAAVMKTTYEKLKPKIINYRDYKKFCNDAFDKFFWRNRLQKILMQIVMVSRNFFKFA